MIVLNPLRLPLIAFLAAWAVGVLAADDASFSEVSGIFASRCVQCHNDIDQEGDFSLQSADSFYDSGFVDPGDGESRLLEVLRHVDGQPPSMPKDSPPLHPDQIATISRWIESGGRWPKGSRVEQPVSDFDWWSFRPVIRPAVPNQQDPWIRTPIDAFVAAMLKKKGLTHSPQADRRTLIRRLSYDLIGLPPTPEQIESFVGDTDPEAYEKLVDRLLESKHYGERWARHWLDVVKYADTCGYDKDKLRRNAWPYRDYVVRSFNDDKPYGRFVQEQIAGDVLFPGESDGILGLGFIAAGPWDFIGHVEVSESKIDGKVARNLDRDEMVSNAMNTFCSVTIQCARCHNHKFDPFTQKHYYRLQAIFAAIDRAERAYDLDPGIEDQRRDIEVRLSESKERKRAVDKEIADAGGQRLKILRQTIEGLQSKVTTIKKPAFGYHSQIAAKPETEKWVEVDLGRPTDLSKIVLYPCHDDHAGIGAGFGFPVRFRVDLSQRPSPTDRRSTLENKPPREPTGESSPAADEPLEIHHLGNFADRDMPNPGLDPLEISCTGVTARFVRLTATKLARRSNDYIFALAELRVFDSQGNDVSGNAIVTSHDSIEAPVRWGKKNLTDGVWARSGKPKLSTRLAAAKKQRSEILEEIETDDRLTRLRAATDDIREARAQLDSLPAGRLVYAASTSFRPQGNFKPTNGVPRPIHLLHRGNVRQTGERVGPGLLPLSDGDHGEMDSTAPEGEHRAELARWLTSDQHPLVWRSIVNRVWQYHFGVGLVDSPNDFGRMGTRPTHPELLDWLAADFRDGGQSLKRLHRLMVTSSVYRQSSKSNQANASIDSSNQYWWRMSPRRLEAEEIRDSILAVSGKLDKTMGGPGFYLFKLEKTEHSPHYEYHKFDPADAKSHRRSIYRFVVRSQPDPFMTTLDCADSSQSTPRRVETLTALQALTLLNNRFNLEMAERFAERLRGEASELPAQIDRAMMLTVGRLPTNDERNEMIDYAETHSLANLCRMMFNLSEFVFLD